MSMMNTFGATSSALFENGNIENAVALEGAKVSSTVPCKRSDAKIQPSMLLLCR